MKRSDLDDLHVLGLARTGGGVIGHLTDEGVPEKVALAKVLHLVDRGLLDYGVSPYFAWVTEEAAILLLREDAAASGARETRA